MTKLVGSNLEQTTWILQLMNLIKDNKFSGRRFEETFWIEYSSRDFSCLAATPVAMLRLNSKRRRLPARPCYGEHKNRFNFSDSLLASVRRCLYCS